ELGEEIAEVAHVGLRGAAPRELEARVPSRRRAEILARVMAASKLIIGGALLGGREHRVRFVDLLHPRFGIRLLRDVGMVLAREPAVRLLDVVLRSIARDAERLVVIAEFHAGSCPASRGGSGLSYRQTPQMKRGRNVRPASRGPA